MAEQAQQDRIMVVDRDPSEREFLVEDTLKPFGYRVDWAEDGASALSMVLQDRPDVLILDLGLEGLSGTDVLAALDAQAVDVPVIVLADRGGEQDALDAFRLGARDYLVRPIREAELIQVIERVMGDVRIRREREALVGEVRQAASETERHLRELRTLMGIGKSVIAVGQPNEVFDRVMRAAVQLTRAETAGLFLRDAESGQLVVQAGHGLSRNLIEAMGGPVEDDLAMLVLNSQESYLGSGGGLEKFRPAQQNVAAVIYSPLVFQDQPIGVLWVANTRLLFEPYMKDIMTALADYASIAVVNSRLFVAMKQRSEQLERMNEQLQAQQPGMGAGEVAAGDVGGSSLAGSALAGSALADEIRALRRPLTELLGNMNLFRTGEMGVLAAGQQAAVDVMHRQLDALVTRLDALVPPDSDA